jgi:hypothetical protein
MVFPPFAVIGVPAAAIFAGVSVGAGVLSTLFTGIEYGFTSSAFAWSAAGSALSVVTFGESKLLTPVAKEVAPVVKEVAQEGGELVSSITSGLSKIF